MGLLDDAIREHLELMRLRGADPTEIARAEAEALGPVVREVAEPEHHEEDADVLSGVDPAPEPESGDEAGHEVPEAADDAGVLEGIELEELDPEPTPEAPDPAVDEAVGLTEETRQFDSLAAASVELGDEELLDEEVLDAPGPGEEPADGDVLEETPDFLADSPDHDRLWFEQSGPRDFDFEGEK